MNTISHARFQRQINFDSFKTRVLLIISLSFIFIGAQSFTDHNILEESYKEKQADYFREILNINENKKRLMKFRTPNAHRSNNT